MLQHLEKEHRPGQFCIEDEFPSPGFWRPGERAWLGVGHGNLASPEPSHADPSGGHRVSGASLRTVAGGLHVALVAGFLLSHTLGSMAACHFIIIGQGTSVTSPRVSSLADPA